MASSLRPSQLPQRFGFDPSNPFTTHVGFLADLFEHLISAGGSV
jgi:hypothetical protein